MANRLLLQTLLKFREGIKSGTAKVQDIITDYVNQTGKSVTDQERSIILNEFAQSAPKNVTPLKSGAFDEIDETMEGFDPNYMKGIDETDITAGELKSKTPFTDKVREQNPGVELRGDETFGELIEKLGKPKNQGIGSLFEKDASGFDDRGEVAEFVRKMRGAGIKNEDIRKIFKENPSYRKSRNFFSNQDMVLDLEPGKRAATTLARAADMGADTPKKQELLSELDELKMDEGPRFFQEEYMGFDNFNAAMDAKKIEVNNAIVDDLETRGVDDEVISSIMGKAREINRSPFYTSGEEFVDIIKEELEFEKIGYDLDFYKKYFREIESLMRKPPSRFVDGGLV